MDARSARGYPESPKIGAPIEIPASLDATVYHAGTSDTPQGLFSSGGRILTVTGIGANLSAAREKAYEAISQISCENSFYRSDIALAASEGK